jgi:FkbM family methyltransferase
MLPPFLSKDRSIVETTARQLCQAVSLNSRFVLCRVLGKYMMYADAEDIGLMPRLCLDGFWESWVTIAMARHLRSGWHCVDVGANHGYFTLLMADAVEGSGRVLAIEPNPHLAEIVSLNIEVNGFQSYATVLQKAATETDAQKTNLLIPPRRAADATICRQATPSDEVVEVETIKLDSALAEWPRVDLIKIDAEGSEESIWGGLRQTLERHRDINIIMEMRCSRYADPRAFVREILAAGFKLRHIGYDGKCVALTEEQVLNERPNEDWMLWLRRR